MRDVAIRLVRGFNRLATRRVGALDHSYLSRGRPLGEARLIFEIGVASADAHASRSPPRAAPNSPPMSGCRTN